MGAFQSCAPRILPHRTDPRVSRAAATYQLQLYAAKNNDLEWLLRSLSCHNPIDVRDPYADTALHHAAVRGYTSACAIILRTEPAIVHAINKGNNTALHLACSTCKLDTVRLLLDAGAEVNARGIEQFTPLHYACRDGKEHEDATAVVRLLLDRGACPTSPCYPWGLKAIHRIRPSCFADPPAA